MDRDEISREHRRQRLSERLGHRSRKNDDHEENEGKEDNTSRWKERNQRHSKKTNYMYLLVYNYVKCEFWYMYMYT